MSDKLIMKFDPKTIEHLGISLYSKLPTVLSELISNSWDADAENIFMDFVDNGEKEIIYKDDGSGMTFEEINEKFLLIGRNRRHNDKTELSPIKKRKVIGKKGLGKLSVFGIAKEVEILTIQNGIKNHFLMNIDKILSKKEGSYEPEIISKNELVSIKNGTKIILKGIKRKSKFEVDDISINLSKKFLIFDKININIKHNDGDYKKITNELKFERFNPQFKWSFPSTEFDFGYENSGKIKGEIMTLETPIKETDMKGIYLTSRGKIVNNSSFYGLRDNDQFHTYVTGYLEIDFIDDLDEDLISTDRQSLNWESDETRDLKDFLQETIKKVSREFTKKRSKLKEEKIKEEKGVDIKKWRDGLSGHEKNLGDKIINPILEDSSININESTSIISNVIDKFENEDFKKYASDISEINSKEIPQLLKLMEQWQITEAKEFSKLALTRIEVIKQFEKLIDEDTLEVPTLHDFLKKFTWLLDPRILEFKDEVKYSQLLKANFSEEDLDEKDRRIDFLCSNALGEILYVIEIKRSKYKVGLKALEQGYDYQAFLTEKYSSKEGREGFSKVVCYVIGGEKNTTDYKFRTKENTYWRSGEVFVKTYKELLEQAKEYHREFIDKYNELIK